MKIKIVFYMIFTVFLSCRNIDKYEGTWVTKFDDFYRAEMIVYPDKTLDFPDDIITLGELSVIITDRDGNNFPDREQEEFQPDPNKRLKGVLDDKANVVFVYKNDKKITFSIIYSSSQSLVLERYGAIIDFIKIGETQ
jgi:hypothetical protein